jgi:hypothetical protein
LSRERNEKDSHFFVIVGGVGGSISSQSEHEKRDEEEKLRHNDRIMIALQQTHYFAHWRRFSISRARKMKINFEM